MFVATAFTPRSDVFKMISTAGFPVLVVGDKSIQCTGLKKK